MTSLSLCPCLVAPPSEGKVPSDPRYCTHGHPSAEARVSEPRGWGLWPCTPPDHGRGAGVIRRGTLLPGAVLHPGLERAGPPSTVGLNACPSIEPGVFVSVGSHPHGQLSTRPVLDGGPGGHPLLLPPRGPFLWSALSSGLRLPELLPVGPEQTVRAKAGWTTA